MLNVTNNFSLPTAEIAEKKNKPDSIFANRSALTIFYHYLIFNLAHTTSHLEKSTKLRRMRDATRQSSSRSSKFAALPVALNF